MLWSAHRTELVSQAYAAIHGLIGGSSLGVIAPGHPMRRGARFQVSSTQTLVERGKPDITPRIIVLDEFHHYAADEFRKLVEWWPDALLLGPTATPQRGDGKPLGDIADALVVAAQYSELVEEGYLCDAVCYQPPEALSGALALDPVEAWKRYSEGMSGFAFMPTIKAARALAAAFNAAGIVAACIDAKTPKAQRADTLRKFASGDIQVITNVDTMTEGVDVPRAGVAMLGRSFQTVSAFLQACGRVLRPHELKKYARIIDLTGATILHGHPTIDRVYSLDGDGIRSGESAENPVRNCLHCGLVYLCAEACCPGCGTAKPPRTKRPQRIYSLELQEVWAGENTKEDAKLREYKRLREVQRSKGLRLWFVIKSYKELFGSAPRLFDVTPQEKKAEFYALLSEGNKRGFKPAFAASRFKEMFGHWPARM